MGEIDRFSRLESAAPLPESVLSAIEKLNRFDHLEIGTVHPAASAPATPALDRVLCPHCGQANEKERTHCWACFAALTDEKLATNKPIPGQPIELVLNGVSYSSEDPNLPPHIRVLMERIRQEGYSPALLADWQRKLQDNPAPASTLGQPLFGDGRVQMFKGQRISILRLDGKIYKSDDANLSPELQEIFRYVDAHGVTPALLQHLRLYGTRVKFRPFTTPTPSDGDHDFWKSAKPLIEPNSSRSSL